VGVGYGRKRGNSWRGEKRKQSQTVQRFVIAVLKKGCSAKRMRGSENAPKNRREGLGRRGMAGIFLPGEENLTGVKRKLLTQAREKRPFLILCAR